MSYRSNVRILVNKEGFEILKKVIEESEKGLSDFTYYNDYLGENGEIIFGWDYLKWYEDYPIVKAIDKTFDDFEENDMPYKIIQIGEDGAIEEREFNSNTFSAYLETSLDFLIGGI